MTIPKIGSRFYFESDVELEEIDVASEENERVDNLAKKAFAKVREDLQTLAQMLKDVETADVENKPAPAPELVIHKEPKGKEMDDVRIAIALAAEEKAVRNANTSAVIGVGLAALFGLGLFARSVSK